VPAHELATHAPLSVRAAAMVIRIARVDRMENE
jgi:hypothetical protein